MDQTILQNVERIGDDDRCTETSMGYDENTMNILGILEDLQYLIQSNMEDCAYQVQCMLADELDAYSG